MNRTSAWLTGWSGLLLAAFALAVALVGCGRGKGASGAVQYYGNYHLAGWVDVHGGKALADLASCTTCHELTVLKVGSGVPSCMTSACHHGTQPGWANADIHGLRAKAAAGPSGGSFASCQICHGKDFSGGGSANACATCHGVQAPHPPKPWRLSAGSSHTHTTADPSNAAVCAQCHYPGSPNNPVGHPSTPAPAGTQPGCYNATLCHANAGAPHPLGPIWTDATSTAFHGIEAKKDLLYCQSCHGAPGTPKFDGGTAATACSTCHTAAFAHSTTWYQDPVQTFPGYVPSHRNAGNLGACGTCHDGLTKGRTAPLPAAPSCYSASYDNGVHGTVGCHSNGPAAANHPIPFTDANHTTVTQAQFTANCASCHAVSGTSPVGAAPACAICHQAASPLAAGSGPGTCLSCHTGPAGLPAGPTGTAFPSIAGAHAKHLGLPTALTCNTCHNGVGAGSLTHYNSANARVALPTSPAPVAISATFNAMSGAAGFSTTALTCSNVSCHGGQTTPSWQTGKLAVNATTYCLACHQITSTATQYNDAIGRHNNPNDHNQTCDYCHDMTLAKPGAQNHFKYLNTTAVSGAPTGTPSDQFPSDTIKFGGGATPATGALTYTVTASTQGLGGCALTCHGTTHTTANNTWN
ncbi:CxxxxCH/CxxCH domain-containing protein [Geothrix campi]|uniref:CxxxxCH/CxxCH domain-containing protein n=1 Tax=Geothrix campi TaxID=2966450 RepID=UPI0021498AAD|nr:CxxxxCH/CxxCH domain-containing protein [Geothrix sp. SG10]